MAANGISTLTIPVGITADSHTASFLVEVGKFTYDAYGTGGFVVRKDGGPIDAYMAQVLALPALSARQYVFDQIDPVEARPFTYGQALISFTLNVSQDGNSTAISNVVCTYGAGGYSASSGQLTMPGDRLIGGVSPENDIVWDYVCAGNDGVITSFAYASGTPPVGRIWTFVPANGEPSFTRAMNQPDGTQFSTEAADGFAAMWNVTTDSDSFLQGTGINELDISLIPMGTEFNIYVAELGTVGQADKEARQIAKLNIAQAKRQGKVVATNGTISGAIDTTKPYYRARNTYNLTLLPDTYVTGADDNTNTSGLLQGRPWYDPNTEAFYDGEVLEVSPGIWRTNYEGYHYERGEFFDTAELKAAPDNFNAADNDINEPSLPNSTSMMLKGYLRVTYTGNYTI